MNPRRILLITVCLLLVAGAWFFWHQPARTRTKPSALPTAAATVHSASTVPGALPSVILSTNNPKAEAAARARANQFRYRLTNTTKTIGALVNDRHAILLANALIDTSAKLDLSIPKKLQASGEPGAYIVQANGPIDNAFRAMLAQSGAQIVSYIPNDAYLVMISSGGANALAGNPMTQAVIPFEPYYKLSPSLLAAAANDQPVGELKVAAFPGTADATISAFGKIGVTVVTEETTPLGPFFVLKNVSDVAAVAQIPTVHIVEPSYRRALANDLSRATVGVAADTQTPTNYFGLTGSNVVVEVNDSGIDATHPDFTTGGIRVSGDSPQSLVDTNGHGTHVAGTIAGNGAESMTVSNAQGSVMPATTNQFRGMAPLAALYSVGFLSGDDTNIISDSYLQEAPVALTNALISNNSWNYDGDSAYDLSAASYDAAVRDALPQVTGSQPVLFVFSAGNEGNGNDSDTAAPGAGTPDSILSPATAKNVITVGAIQEFRSITNAVTNADGTISQPWYTNTSTPYLIAGFSSRGNVGIGTEGTYGRFKPDVVAPGTSIISTRSSQWDIGTYFYASPTNYKVQVFSPVIIQAGSQYERPFPKVLTNTVQVTIQLEPTGDSPYPFPLLPIYFALDNSPVFNHFTTNDQVSIPPDDGLTIADILGSEQNNAFYYSVSNNTPEPININVVLDTITTNNPGNYYLVYSNLDQSLGGVNPASTGPGPYYRYETGTSMSAADVSGVLALMQDYFINTLHTPPSPALLKALLINGARSTDASDYDYQAQNNINYEGWGLINLPDSLPPGVTNQIDTGCSSFFVDQSPTNALATGDSHTFMVIVSTNAQQALLPLRVTVVWTDPPGDPAAAIKLVNSLGLVVSNLDNPANPVVFYGNDIQSGIYNQPEGTNTPAIFDNINNVQNVFIWPLGTNYSITVIGRDVNVNAVSAQTNNAAGAYAPNVVQDFALVVSCGEGELTNAITTVLDQGVVLNPTLGQQITFLGGTNSNAPLLNQFVGANTPLLGTNTVPIGTITVLDTNGAPIPISPGFAANAVVTVGMTNQWHFYVVTNNGANADFTNAAFITFLPDTLSIPRMGVFADSTATATRPEADIDLYVASGPNAWGLTNLDPNVISNCVHGTQVGLSSPVGVAGVFNGASLSRGGTEFVADIGSTPGQVYYVGVKSEDQMAAEYDFLSIFSSTPFSTMNGGVQTVNGQLLPINIPDGSPAHPGIAYIFGLAIYPITAGQVVVGDSIVHQNYGDLIGTLNHNDIRDVLNNHDSFGNPPGPYTYTYDDSGSGNYPGSRLSDGPGNLLDFAGTTGIGPWMLSEVDDSLTQTGYVAGYTLTIAPHQDLTKGFQVTIPPQSWFYDYIDVPVGYTNLSVFATNLPPSATAPNYLVLAVQQGSPPTLADTNYTTLLTNSGPTGLGGMVSVGPPLAPGRYWVGIYNPSLSPETVYIIATLSFSASAIETADFDSSGPVPILDDAVTTNAIFVPRTDIVQDFNVGLRVDHPRISDLVFHLISPDGTRYLLMENRGGTSTAGCGVTITNTFFVPVSSAGGAAANTNVINTGLSSGTINISYDFFPVPDRMVVYDGTTLLWDSGYVSYTDVTNLTYSGSPIITIIMNPGNNPNPNTAWEYTVSSAEAKNYYLAFTEDTNLTTTPIKFAPPPFTPSTATNQVYADGFEGMVAADYTNGQTFGNGWTVITNQVSVVTDPTNAYEGSNFLALANGVIATNLPTVAGQTYQLSFAYRGPGIVSLWRGESNTVDSISGNNGHPSAAIDYTPTGEVGSAFFLNNSNAYFWAAANPSLNVGIGGGLTLDGWINVSNVDALCPIAEWNNAVNGYGVQLWINDQPVSEGGSDQGVLSATFLNTSGLNFIHVKSPNNTLVANTNQHFAVTYNHTTGWIYLYVNGAPVQSYFWGADTPLTSYDFWVAHRPQLCTGCSTENTFLGGMLDEFSLYNRALSASEINAIYQKGHAGKYDPNLINTSPSLSLAEAAVNLPGAYPATLNGANTNWQVFSTTFTATQNGTPLQITGLEPGMLLDGFTLTEVPNNLYYQPEEPMDGSNGKEGINGRSAFGEWTLEIQDDRAGATNPAPVLQSWQLEFTYANTNIPIPTVPVGEALTNTVAANSIAWYQVNVPDGALYATNRLLFATAPVNVWFSTNNPATTNKPGDVVLITNATSGSATLSPVTSPPLLPDETYYLGVQNPNSFVVTNAIEVDFFIPLLTPILGGQPQTNIIAAGGADYFWVYVPANADYATNLLLSATGPVNLWFDQTYLPTGTNPPDYLLLTNSTGGSSILDTNTVPPLLPGQIYFLEVQNTNSFAVTNILQVDFHLLTTGPPAPIVISGVVTNIGGTNGFLLTWYAPTNDEFLVQWTSNLLSPVAWNTFTNIITYTSLTPTNGIGFFEFFDNGTQTGGMDTMRFYRLLLIAGLSGGVAQTNSVSAGGTDYFLINVPTNADFATNTLLFAGAPVNLWLDTNTPPTTNVFLFSGTNGSYTLSATGVPPLVPGGLYWLAVQNTNSFPVSFGLEVDFHLRTAANNPLTISSITFTNQTGTNGFLLVWFAPTNDVFQVEWTDSLLPVNWQFFTGFIYYTGPPTPTNGLFSFFDNGSQTPPGLPPARFYRILLVGSLPSTRTNTVFISSLTSTNLTGTNGLWLAWSAPTNYLFEVQWTTNLLPIITWQTFPDIIGYSTFVSPTNSLFNFFDNGTEGGLGPLKFYRLILLP
jgi:subtilisin-like proprotein convertase family protein